MNFTAVLDLWGEGVVLAMGGLIVGLLFGGFAQRSQFCLRAGVVEFARGSMGPRFTVWIIAFSAAVFFTQLAIASGLLDVSESRQLASRGSLSGALIGGLLFGIGMILARGCASRLLVLSGTGNMRAIVSGLILTIVAQASLRGVLSPLREQLSSLWTVAGGPSRDLAALLGFDTPVALGLGALWLAFGLWLARRNHVKACFGWAGAIGVGFTIALGWVFTYSLSQQSFEPVAIKSVSFTGPSADTLMALVNRPWVPLGFDVALVPGVFLGALMTAVASGKFKLQGFECGTCMVRYMSGAVLMGFGGMLAGGCAVGAGVTGGSIFALTAWLALSAMWVGAAATDWLVDRRGARAEAPEAAVLLSAEQIEAHSKLAAAG